MFLDLKSEKQKGRALHKNKIKILLICLTAMTSCVCIIATSVFAWFNFNKDVGTSIVTTSGKIKFDSVAATAYKYVYPTLGGESGVINYDGAGTVTSYNFITENIDMNKYDPFYLNLNSLKVKDIMTNIAVKFDVTFSIASDVNLNLNLKLDPSVASNKYNIHSYLDFWSNTADLASDNTDVSWTSTNGTAYSFASGTDTNFDNDKIFYRMKNYQENTTDNPALNFATGSSVLNVYSSSYTYASGTIDSLTSLSSHTVSFYVGIDYNESSLKATADGLTADVTVNLPMDYYFEIEAAQK